MLCAVLFGATVALAATTTVSYTTKAGDTLNGVPLVVGQVVQEIVTVTPPPVVPPTAGEILIANTYTTGYGYPDNTPKNSAAIALPVLHTTAGGTGTFADPITIAVGHVISGGKDTPDFPAGTKFYIPNVRAYFIVEDLCGDGNTPQNGPCHNLTAKNDSAPAGAKLWLDMWVGGVGQTSKGTIACEEQLTDLHTVIENPAPNYAVVAGQLYTGTCRTQFGNATTTQ